jgi:hypothetical protein
MPNQAPGTHGIALSTPKMSCVLSAVVLLANTAVVDGKRMNISDRRLLQSEI